LDLQVMLVDQESSTFRKTRYHLNEFSSRNRPQMQMSYSTLGTLASG
jgi:hypothetical protein